jgi:hypothetical protein
MASLQQKVHELQAKALLCNYKPGYMHGVLYFGCNTEVFEEALVRRPKLAPHGFLHALLCVHQLCSILELAHGFHPLRVKSRANEQHLRRDHRFSRRL